MKHDERGVVNPLLIATILLAVFLVAAAGAFVWAYSGMVDWQKNGQTKVDSAVADAKEQQQKDDQAKFNEEQKKPNLTYQGPSEMGSVRFDYPKTWSGYTAESSNNDLQVYFYPSMVPKVNPDVTPYALRVSVTNDTYSDVIKSYESLVENGKATANPTVIGAKEGFAGYSGMRVDGQLSDTINGSVVIFKVRDKTLRMYVDRSDFVNDFNNTILRTLQFQP